VEEKSRESNAYIFYDNICLVKRDNISLHYRKVSVQNKTPTSISAFCENKYTAFLFREKWMMKQKWIIWIKCYTMLESVISFCLALVANNHSLCRSRFTSFTFEERVYIYLYLRFINVLL